MSFKNHFFHYLVLALILGGAIFGFWYFYSNKFFRFSVVFVALLLYVIWGIVHHRLEGRLSRKVVLEYLLLSLIILAAFSLTTSF